LGLSTVELEARMSDLVSRLKLTGRGKLARLGVPLLDDYLEFVAGRCSANTVLATALDLKVFFMVVTA